MVTLSNETRVMRQLFIYGKLPDDLIAKLAGMPLYVARAARRRLVKRGEVVAWKVWSGQMVWKLANC